MKSFELVSIHQAWRLSRLSLCGFMRLVLAGDPLISDVGSERNSDCSNVPLIELLEFVFLDRDDRPDAHDAHHDEHHGESRRRRLSARSSQ